MTTSNTELAAQARAVAKALWTYSEFDFDGDFRNAANLLRQLADALETRGKPVVVWDSDGWGELLVDSLPDGTQLYAAPVQPEKDERKAESELIKLAGWLLSPEPDRHMATLEDASHIGHRQYRRVQEATQDTLRLKAIEIRNFVDALRASRPAHGIGSSTEGGV